MAATPLIGSSDKAEAARLVGEGVQIQAAVQAFRAQEDRYPGIGAGLDQAAINDLLARKYLTNMPAGIYNAEGSVQNWQIDYTHGIARATLGSTENVKAMNICRAARKQLSLAGEPQRCDGSGSPGGIIPDKEPCCIMPVAEAGIG